LNFALIANENYFDTALTVNEKVLSNKVQMDRGNLTTLSTSFYYLSSNVNKTHARCPLDKRESETDHPRGSILVFTCRTE
jgi:hypothetical protein